MKFKRGDLVVVAPGYRRMLREDYHNKVGIVERTPIWNRDLHDRHTSIHVRWLFNGKSLIITSKGLTLLKRV
jgi:hypothetical protein